jgi:hypothetical protein
MKITRRKFVVSTVVSSSALWLGSNMSLNLKSNSFARLDSPPRLSRNEFTHWTWKNAVDQPDADEQEFKFWFDPVIERRPYDFRQEVVRAAEKLDSLRQGKTLAVCVSGGLDSEVLVRTIHQLGLPYEMYFLDNWGRNRDTFQQWVKPLAQELNRKVQVVSLDRSYFYDQYAPQVFGELSCDAPTSLMMTYLFKSIPQDQYIVTGSGGLDRSGDLYEFLADKHPVAKDYHGIPIPVSTSSVAYDIWAKTAKREGEWYFFHSTPELIAATLLHPGVKIAYPLVQTNAMITATFPEVATRAKTTNWDSPLAKIENSELRLKLAHHSANFEHQKNWFPAIGTVCQYDRLFV